MNKKIKILFAVLAAIMIFAACSAEIEAEDTSNYDADETEETEQMNEVMLSLSDAVPMSPEGISEVQLGFNLNLLKQLSALEDGNLFYSSMSINAALSMVYFGAEGETQEEIAAALGYGDMSLEEVAAYQKYLNESFEDSGDTTFTSANSIWIDNELEVKTSYMDTMDDVFDTLVTNLDLQSSSAASELNSWIDDATNGMITKLFDEGDGSLSDAAMVLMNAIYFKGEWTVPFDPDDTFDAVFNGEESTSDISMMYSNETVMGNVGDDYVSVYLPYGDDERFAMVAVLPDDMDSFIESLTEDELNSILSTFEEQDDPILQIPVFELEEKIELSDVLQALGINKAFTNDAEFGLISDTGLAIDEVLHKARIKVDEEGTEAAAVTAIVMRATGMALDRFEFIADQPFLFFIVDTENDLVLFTGKVTDLE